MEITAFGDFAPEELKQAITHLAFCPGWPNAMVRLKQSVDTEEWSWRL